MEVFFKPHIRRIYLNLAFPEKCLQPKRYSNRSLSEASLLGVSGEIMWAERKRKSLGYSFKVCPIPSISRLQFQLYWERAELEEEYNVKWRMKQLVVNVPLHKERRNDAIWVVLTYTKVIPSSLTYYKTILMRIESRSFKKWLKKKKIQ